MARREALLLLPWVSNTASLQEIEAALIASGRKNRLALEDRDYDSYGVEMNRIISQRPHGRSPSIGQKTAKQKNGFVDDNVAKAFVAALAASFLAPPGCPKTAKSGGVNFTWTKAGNEHEFAKLAETLDAVVLAFEPGRENEGPVNIAVYERRGGEVKCWPNCSPWCMADGSNFMLVSDDCEAGLLFAVSSLVTVYDVPHDYFGAHVEIALRVLRQTASQIQM